MKIEQRLQKLEQSQTKQTVMVAYDLSDWSNAELERFELLLTKKAEGLSLTDDEETELQTLCEKIK